MTPLQKSQALDIQATEDAEYETLLDEQRNLLRRMAQNRFRWNGGAPISNLYSELLVEIFLIVRNKSLMEESKHRNFGWTKGCTDVCVRWREAALAAPTLWNVVFATRHDNPAETDQISTILSRCANSKFALHCIRSPKPGSSSDPTLFLLGQHMSRMVALDWRGPAEALQVLFEGLRSRYPDQTAAASSLRRLNCTTDSQQLQNLVFLLDSAPQLHEFHWNGNPYVLDIPNSLPPDASTFHSVRKLSLHGQGIEYRKSIIAWNTPSDFLTFLQFFPLLEYLSVQDFLVDGLAVSLKQQTSSTPISFEHLTTLCLISTHASTVLGVISNIHVPSLVSLDLIHMTCSDSSQLHSLVSLCVTKLARGATFSARERFTSLLQKAWLFFRVEELRRAVGETEEDEILGHVERLELQGFLDLTPFTNAMSVKTLVLDDTGARKLFSMLSDEDLPLFPLLQTVIFQPGTGVMSGSEVSDLTSFLSRRLSHGIPIHRVVFSGLNNPSTDYQMLLQFRLVQELVLEGVVHSSIDVNEERAEEECVSTECEN
ncbi:hypothetical protein DL96DRAFT_1720260 [Flagelloscypha sp. PMI_526]|nr:hypothetical protein DL96DRAFT_1720260 [Flagelloscypha sp. PMI_526]